MMNAQKTRIALLLAASAATLALGGCGGDDGNDGNPGNPGGELQVKSKSCISALSKLLSKAVSQRLNLP